MAGMADELDPPPPNGGLAQILHDALQGYWNRWGRYAREGLATADRGAQSVRQGNLAGIGDMLLGPLGYVASPVDALFPVEEAYQSLPKEAAPLGAGVLSAMSMAVGNKKGMRPVNVADEGITAYHGSLPVMSPSGEPLTLYRGQFKNPRPDDSRIKGNLFFSDKRSIGEFYAKGDARELVEANLSFKNPYVVDAKGNGWLEVPAPQSVKDSWGNPDKTLQIDDLAKWAREQGHDGLIVRDVGDQAGYGDQYVAFYPEQVKRLNPRADEGITAYHGSPHTFDRFDMSKIGTGEGAQAYGHGLYFAEKEGTARAYREKLAPTDGSMAKPDAQAVKDYGSQWDALVQKRRALTADDGRPLPGADAIDDQMDALHAQMVADSIKRNPSLAGGSMYQVRLNVKPDELLDWDRPLSEQHSAAKLAISKAYKAAGVDIPVGGPFLSATDLRGSDAYESIGRTMHPGSGSKVSSPQVAEHLKAAGIKGIRYKDAGSRASEGGTYNYVIFDDKLVDILKRYGIPVTLGAGGTAIVSGQDMPPELVAQLGPQG